MLAKSSVAALAGATLAAGVMVAPGVLAAPVQGRAATWGSNTYGQLGNNSTTDSQVPVQPAGVLAGKTLTAISAGYTHTCAVADGRAYCWGYNSSGQLGNDSTTDSAGPVAVDTSGVLNGKTVTAISAGYVHTCAVADGRTYCWGGGMFGRLGNGRTDDLTVPVAVDTSGVLNGKTVTAISTGFHHSCAVADGRAFCWGHNADGQLGNDSTGDSAVPVGAAGALGDRTVTAISTGAHHSCAVADGRAYCWGYNAFGQLGNDSTAVSLVPVQASGLLAGKTLTAIGTGSGHTCAVADGRAYCWGYNLGGELGNNSTTDSQVPVAVDTSGALSARTVTAISAGGLDSCAVADGRAYCWGDDYTSQVPVAVDTSGVLNGKTVTAISTGNSHTAVLAATAPQPPTAVTGHAGDRSVTVSWSTPVDDGGSPVLEYVATADPGGAACSSAATSCTVSGLPNGTAYTFTVTARNGIGVSTPSAPSAPVTPRARAAGAVKGLKAKVKKGTVRITWKAATGATSYRIRLSKPGGKKYRHWSSTTKRVFKAEVRKGRKYRFQIAAVGPGGRGPITSIRFKGK